MISRKPKLFILWVSILIGASTILAPSPAPVGANSSMWQQYTYRGPAGSRPYFVYTPPDYQVGTAVPLVVMLHGCGQTAVDFAAATQMNTLADQYDFIVVYPQQMRAYNQGLCWNWFNPVNQSRDSGEPAIITGIVQMVEQDTAQWTIDTNRIYVTGFSAGGAMAVILGATYPDIFAAIGAHSGVEFQAATSASSGLNAMRRGGPDPTSQGQLAYNAMGDFARVVPTIVFQGTSDSVVNSINGDQVVQQWLETDYLASNDTYNASFDHPSSTTDGQVPGGRSYTTYGWNDENGNELQEYWRVNGMGHAWSGGNASSSYTDFQGPDASLAMYNFFMSHPMNEETSQGISFWENLLRAGARIFKG